MNVNLFPPIGDTYIPVFIQGEVCNIYFTISQFNSIEEIDLNLIQVTVVNPNNNKSILDLNKYPNLIKLCEAKQNTNEYYIEIQSDDIDPNVLTEKGGLPLNQYFKVQIRFTSKYLEEKPENSNMGTWLEKYKAYFSEWSTPCLIRNISKPIWTFPYIENTDEIIEENGLNIYSLKSLTKLQGLMSYDDNETEPLNAYKVYIFDGESGILLDESNLIYTNFDSPNNINYDIKYQLKYNSYYTIDIEYYTVNGYVGVVRLPIYIQKVNLDFLKGKIEAAADNENGLVRLTVALYRGPQESTGTLYIRRSSYNSNFDSWEIVHKVKVHFIKYLTNYYWEDMTAESGVLYKYSVQFIEEKFNQAGKDMSPIISQMVMLDIEDLYLMNQNVQLKIKFNPSISSFKYVVTESITNTLGSKYPVVRRNGNNSYRQFQIGGLISFLADPDEDITEISMLADSTKHGKTTTQDSLFLSRSEAFKTAERFYSQYNEDNRILKETDIIFEKIFRDKAINFLCDNSAKLFRSNTEGNILVRLTNIAFTPNQQLSRRIYSFTATATEIDDCNIDNFYKYGIIKEGSDEFESHYIIETIDDKQGFNGYDEINDTVYISYQKLLESKDGKAIVLNEEQIQKP